MTYINNNHFKPDCQLGFLLIEASLALFCSSLLAIYLLAWHVNFYDISFECRKRVEVMNYAQSYLDHYKVFKMEPDWPRPDDIKINITKTRYLDDFMILNLQVSCQSKVFKEIMINLIYGYMNEAS